MSLSLVSCKKSEEGYVENGELVVIQDYSDITLGVYGIDTLNPVATKSKSVQKIMNIIYEPLFTIDENGKADPILADSYSIADSGTQITVKLKNGVKWHDGTNFTAEDVTYTLSKMRDAGGLYSKIASKIYSFTAVDKNTVVVNFADKEPASQYLLTFPIIPRHIAYSQDNSYTPMGTGSYKFISKSGTEMVLEPNSIWHEGEVSERKIIVRILRDKQSVADAFNVGEIDAITSDDLVEGINQKSKSHTKTMVSDKMVFLGFNMWSPAIPTKEIRKAINEFLDRKKMVEQDAYSMAVATMLSVDPTSWVNSREPVDEVENYAEKLMEEAGYSVKDGVYQKDGIKLAARLLVNDDNAQRAALAESIASTLRIAGFDIYVEKVSYEEYIAKIGADDFDMFIGETEVGANINPAAMLTGDDNYFNFDATEVVKAVGRLSTVTDEEEIKKQISDFSILFYFDPPYLPLYFKTENVIYGSYVSGIEKPVSFDPFKDIEKWYFYDKDGKENKGNADE